MRRNLPVDSSNGNYFRKPFSNFVFYLLLVPAITASCSSVSLSQAYITANDFYIAENITSGSAATQYLHTYTNDTVGGAGWDLVVDGTQGHAATTGIAAPSPYNVFYKLTRPYVGFDWRR
ncbi:MAG: hypothetical protein ACRD43_13345 [Pyrinomonadaceae bacterium]